MFFIPISRWAIAPVFKLLDIRREPGLSPFGYQFVSLKDSCRNPDAFLLLGNGSRFLRDPCFAKTRFESSIAEVVCLIAKITFEPNQLNGSMRHVRTPPRKRAIGPVVS
jgi:hypothetical protein